MSASIDPRIIAAARNNAEWCAAVWRSHDLAVEQAHGLLFTRSNPPPYYPNAVAVDPNIDPDEQADFLAALGRDVPPFAVKDSFANLSLERHGFKTLFEARWLWMEQGRAPASTSTKRWQRVGTPMGLQEWEAAWRDGADGPVGLFKPALLNDLSASILASPDLSGHVLAGAIAYQAAGVIGITNAFGDEDGLLAAILSEKKTQTAVRYEQRKALHVCVRNGYADLGSLKVWATP